MTLQERLRHHRVVLKSGDYDGAQLMAAWIDMINAADRIDALEEALQYMVNVCPPINSQGEEAHERARAALGDG